MATSTDVVTSSLSAFDSTRPEDARTPTTPKPITSTFSRPAADDSNKDDRDPRTPTMYTFGGVSGQRPLPDTPLTPSQPSDPMDESNHRSAARESTPGAPGSQDVEMGEADENPGVDDDGSDNDSVTSDSQRPSKKKKGQRFYCTDFPPCQLSFTRSEHLARHIRKHTGERPFQCHCSRRFSRLDNLRQHAQTVHVNEEIPGDSLAATSTRFQRQIRTDRVRPPGSRSRANTVASSGGHSRGHSRNVSTSSIGSTASSIGIPEETRKRPQPLAMANDPSNRARLSLETYSNLTGAPGQYTYYQQSPSGYSTPTSAAYSTETGSPSFGSMMASPVSATSRSTFYNGARHGRRLSVPSAPHPFQTPVGNTYPPPYYGPPVQQPALSTFSPNGSGFGSPTSSVYSQSRNELETELEYRRRTWHPGTYPNYSQRPATSGLSYQQTPDDQRPSASEQPAASQVTRLPGIESFDHAARQQPSPGKADASPRPASSGRQMEAAPHQSMARLDIAAANAPVEGQWQIPPQPPQQQAYYVQQPQNVPPPQVQTQPAPQPEPVTPRRNKRQAWYGGPVNQPPPQGHPAYTPHRPSPEDSGSSDGVPTPSTSQASEYHPLIINPNGISEPMYASSSVMHDDPAQQHKAYTQQPSTPQTYALQAGHDPRFASAAAYSSTPTGPANNDMGRLEALVAVATSETRAVERS